MVEMKETLFQCHFTMVNLQLIKEASRIVTDGEKLGVGAADTSAQKLPIASTRMLD